MLSSPNNSHTIITNRTSELKESILEARLTTLISLVKACHAKIEFYGPSRDSIRCRRGKAQCDTLIFGSLVKYFLSNRIWPGTPAKLASEMSGISVKTLSARMNAFMSDQWPSSGYQDHDSCISTSQLSNEASAVLRDMSSGMLESHIKHMEVQHRKLDQTTSLLKRVQMPPAQVSHSQ